MSLLHLAVLCLIPLVASGPIINAATSDLARRNEESSNFHRRLFRRQDYIESSGATPNITISVPLSSPPPKVELTSFQMRIPYTSLVATAYSPGGGTGEYIKGGAFGGRLSGRGTRNEIYGTARYGSGYGVYNEEVGGKFTYTPQPSNLLVAARGFPHGFPPLTFGNYSAGQEYTTKAASIDNFPGVVMVSDGWPTTLEQTRTMAVVARKHNQSWIIIADGLTINLLIKVLELPEDQGGCKIEPYTQAESIREMNGYYLSTRLQFNFYREVYPWNVVQWYRGSSILLANTTYDNTFAHANSALDYAKNSPLNTTGVEMDFLQCLNQTIAAAAPIIDPTLIVHTRLTPGQMAGVVIGSVAGAALLAAGIWVLLRHRRQRKQTAAPAEGKHPPRPSSITKGLGIGEAPAEDEHELAERHTFLAATAVDSSSSSSHDPPHPERGS